MQSGIYKILNKVNNNFYIGSAVNFLKRKNVHFHHLRKNTHHSPHLQNAWNKYGEENFEFEILEMCSLEELIDREQCYLDTLNPTYNVAKVAGSLRGYRFTEEQKKKVSEANRRRERQHGKPVIVMDKNYNVLYEFCSARDCSRNINIDYRAISQCCTGRLNSYGDYIFCFKKDLHLLDKNKYLRNRGVLQYSLTGEFVREYKCVTEASKGTGLGTSTICRICNDQVKKPRKFIFKYKYV